MTNGRCTILDWPRLTIIIRQAGGIQTFWHQTSDSLMSSYIMYHSKTLDGFAHWVCYKLGQIWLAKPSLLWILSYSSCDPPVCCFISASCVCASNTIQVKYNICTLCHIIVYCLSITSDLYAMWVKSVKEHITEKSMMFLSMSSTHAQLKNQHQDHHHHHHHIP